MIRILKKLKRIIESEYALSKELRTSSNTEFWTVRNVTEHKKYSSREESLDSFDWRVKQYFFYEELMPVKGFDDNVVLDYGCGPGHDVVGFSAYSKPSKVIAMDISKKSLEEAKERLSLQPEANVDFHLIVDGSKELPIENESVDYIHSSGVLHHTPNIEEILQQFHRILKRDGSCRIMVYNYYSLWMHLYVGYKMRILGELSDKEPLEETFRKSTDGGGCPISRAYKPDEFIHLCNKCGFETTYLGAAISTIELSLLPLRYDAIVDQQLPRLHRHFLCALKFDEYGRPMYKGQVAGIDAIYELKKL